jgi:hypothetical protein
MNVGGRFEGENELISAEELAEVLLAVDGRHPVSITDLTVRGTLDLQGRLLRRPVEFKNSRFDGAADLSRLQAASGLTFEDCTFSDRIDLTAAAVHGALVLRECKIGSQLILKSTSVTRDLNLIEVEVGGRVEASNLEAMGDVLFNVRHGHGLEQMTIAITLRRAAIQGRLTIESSGGADGHITGGIDLGEIEVGKQLSIESIHLTNNGGIDLTGCHVEDGLFIQARRGECVIPGDIVLSRGRMRRVSIDGGDGTGSAGLTIGSLTIDGLNLDDRMVIQGGVKLGLLVGSGVTSTGLSLDSGVDIGEIRLAGCSLGAVYVQMKSTISTVLAITVSTLNRFVLDDVAITGTSTIGGSLDLSGTEVHGDVRLNRTTITGTVNMSRMTVDRTVVVSRCIFGREPSIVSLSFGNSRLRDELIFEPRRDTDPAVELKGDLDLSGCVVRGSVKFGEGTVVAHKVNARMLEVNHVLDLAFLGENPGTSVDLDSARIGILNIDPGADFWPASSIAGLEYERIILSGRLPAPNGRASPLLERIGFSRTEPGIEWLECVGSQRKSAASPPAAPVPAIDGFRQLAVSLSSEGRVRAAEKTMMASRRSTSMSAGIAARTWSGVWRIFNGFGYRPLRSVWILVTFLALYTSFLAGSGLARQAITASVSDGPVVSAAPGKDPLAATRRTTASDSCAGAGVPCFSPFVYSLETLVPVIDLGQHKAWHFDVRKPWGRTLVYVETTLKGLGWILTSVALLSLARYQRDRSTMLDG